ncbi:hypothetical protein KR222_000970, partial [Zaprionus bogoriensis]
MDVKNAFNSAKWSGILRALENFRVPPYLIRMVRSYFSGRVLRYDTDDGLRTHDVTLGVPQGSVLGPLLWNAMYDAVLKLELPENTQLIGFADDIALVVGKHIVTTEEACNSAIRRVHHWLAAAGLELAAHKTEAVLVSSRKVVETARIMVGSTVVQ